AISAAMTSPSSPAISLADTRSLPVSSIMGNLLEETEVEIPADLPVLGAHPAIGFVEAHRRPRQSGKQWRQSLAGGEGMALPVEQPGIDDIPVGAVLGAQQLGECPGGVA